MRPGFKLNKNSILKTHYLNTCRTLVAEVTAAVSTVVAAGINDVDLIRCI